MSEASARRELSGRVAIVTGASSGIGRAAAVELRRRGAKVLGVARDAERLDALKTEAGVEVLPLSLADEASCRTTVEAAREKLGPVTILVHAAGRGGYLDRPIFEQPFAEWRETFAVNLDAAFLLAKFVAHDVRGERWGRMVMISSTAGEIGAPSMAPYCASKHGLIGLMRSVALDLAPHGGTCNAILPGWVRTEMAERDAEAEAGRRRVSVDAVWAERAAANPRGSIVTLDEVAGTIAFLAGPASSGINGQAITVSAGSLW